MKYRYSVLAIGVFVALLFWWWRHQWPVQLAKDLEPKMSAAAIGTPNSQSTPVNVTSLEPLSPRIDPKIEAVKLEFERANAKTMDTYGIVVDQNRSPVQGVKVEEGVGLYVSPIHSGGKRYYTETDADGKFFVVNVRGAWAGFNFTKEGYTYDLKSSTSTRPSDYTPDQEHPLIFSIWKLRGPEPMVHKRIDVGLLCDGSAMTLDLLTGHRVASGGDLTSAAQSILIPPSRLIGQLKCP